MSGEYIRCRTRTGKKIHLAVVGSSVTFCGTWLRADSRMFEVDAPSVTCENCRRAAEVSVLTDHSALDERPSDR